MSPRMRLSEADMDRALGLLEAGRSMRRLGGAWAWPPASSAKHITITNLQEPLCINMVAVDHGQQHPRKTDFWGLWSSEIPPHHPEGCKSGSGMPQECHFHAKLSETGCLTPGIDHAGQLSEFLYGSITESIGKNGAKGIVTGHLEIEIQYIPGMNQDFVCTLLTVVCSKYTKTFNCWIDAFSWKYITYDKNLW